MWQTIKGGKTSGRILGALVIATFFILAYETTNHFGPFAPRQVPFVFGEQNIPFLPWTAFVYLSVFAEMLLAVFLVRRRDFAPALIAALGLIIFHSLIFFFLPTAYPRPNISVSGFGSFWYHLLIFIDTARNCFPSLHIAELTLVTPLVWRAGRRLGIIFVIWSLLVVVSTLTAKQHYLLDIFGGFATGLGAYWVMLKVSF